MNVLITNNKISQKNAIKICFRDDKIKKFISNFPERNIYQSEKYNLKFIEIFPDKDDLHDFLEFEEDTINEDTINIKNMNIFMPYYSNETLSINIGKVANYKEDISLSKEENSLYPVILCNNFKLIGISFNQKEDNFILLKAPLLEFIKNEIIIKIRVDYNDINKDIHILNNPNYKDLTGKMLSSEVNEINSSNAIMYINGEKSKFQKCI